MKVVDNVYFYKQKVEGFPMRTVINAVIKDLLPLRTAYSYMLLHWRDRNIIAEIKHDGMIFQEKVTDVDKARDVYMYIFNRWNKTKIRLNIVEYDKESCDPVVAKIRSLFSRRKVNPT